MFLCLTGFERSGVLERKGLQSSRCLAYLNGGPPHPLPRSQDSVWIGAGSFVSAFILVITKCLKECRQGYQRVLGDPPLPIGTALGGESQALPSMALFCYSRRARGFHLCCRSCLTRRKAAIVSSFFPFVFVAAGVSQGARVSLGLGPHSWLQSGIGVFSLS